MKNDRSIKLITDEPMDEQAPVLDAADLGGEFEEMDALLRLVADESTAQIDFEAIKQRAVSSAKAKKARRGKLRRAVSYALFACAALVMGFSLLTVIRSAGKPNDPNVIAYSTPDGAPKETHANGSKGASGDQTPIWRMEAGTVSKDAYKDITKKVSDFFPTELPENMMKLVDDSEAHISAIGINRDGSELCYDLVMSTEPPINLETGEACSVEDGEFIVYYWQISEENCVSFRFTGFEQKQTDSMFGALARRIVQIVPDDGQR